MKRNVRKSSLLIVSVLSIFVGFAQTDDGKVQSSLNFGFGIPQKLSSNGETVLVEDMELSQKSFMAYGFDYRAIFPSKMSVSVGLSSNQYQFDNDSILFSANILSAYMGYGINLNLGERIRFGTDFNFGCVLSRQSLFVDKDIQDVYYSFQTNNQNLFIKQSKLLFNLSVAPQLSFQMTQKISLFLKVNYSFFNYRKLGQINNEYLFNNFSNALIGISLNK